MRDETLDYLEKVCNAIARVATQIRTETDEVIAEGNHVNIIKHYDAIRKGADRIRKSREVMSEVEEFLSRNAIPDVFIKVRETTGEKPPFNIEGVGKVSVSHKFSCSMPYKEVGIAWLKTNGHGGLVQETVNSSALAAFAKNMLQVEGQELPADVFKVSMMPYTSIKAV